MATLESLDTKERRTVHTSELSRLKDSLELRILDEPQSALDLIDLLSRDDAERKYLRKLPLDGASEAQIRHTIFKSRWLRALHSIGYEFFRASEVWDLDLVRLSQVWQLTPIPTAETLARWEAQLNEGSGQTAAVVPHFDARGGAGQGRIDRRADLIVLEVIEAARHGKLTLSATDVKKEVHARIRSINESPQAKPSHMPLPSLSTVARRFRENVSPFEMAVAKYGENRASGKFAPTERRPRAGFVGAITEFDDFDTELFCIDEQTGLPWGRPWVTWGIDQEASFPTGLSMDTRPRSAWSAISALVHSVESKNLSFMGERGANLTWEAQGYSTCVLFDNALFNNPRFVTLDGNVADPGWAKPFTPQEKNVVEYSNGLAKTLFIRRLPGYRGLFDDRDAIDEGLGTAVLPFRVFKIAFHLWMLGDYMNTPMADGRTRREKYLEIGEFSFRSKLAPDVRRLRLLRTLPSKDLVKWNKNGIRYMGLAYQDRDTFHRWVRSPGGSLSVQIRVDPEDLTHVYVSIPNSDDVLVLPCLDRDYAVGLSLHQQRLILKMCYEKKNSHPSLGDMYRARSDLAKLISQWRKSSKIRLRKRAARVGDVPSKSKKSTTSDAAVSEVEYGHDEIDAIEMAEGDAGWGLPCHA